MDGVMEIRRGFDATKREGLDNGAPDFSGQERFS